MAGPEGDHAAVIQAGQWKHAVQAYLATIAFLDDEVGRLLNALEKSPRGRDTIVVWWTDHGWALGEKEHWRKFALWKDTTRTSFAISAPGITQPGTRTTAAVDYTSVFPTLCELAGLPVPAHVKGPSLLPLLRKPDAAWDHVSVCSHGRGNHAAVDAQWRYIRYADGSEELYDHLADPHEWTNRASEPALTAVKERLAAALPRLDQEAPPTSGGKGGNSSAKPRKGDGKGQGKGKAKNKGKGKEKPPTQ
jgi:arylsulfatase A-like enzyme